MLSDADIRKALDAGLIEIQGLVPDSIQPASVDFHLSDKNFKIWAHRHPYQNEILGIGFGMQIGQPIVPWVDQSREMIDLPMQESGSHGRCFILQPMQFALASTTERVRIGSRLAGRLEGKSSLARLGLIVHTTAGFFDPGFEGYPTLELLNVSPRPMLLRPDMPIAQMAFVPMSSPVEVPYNERGHYADQGADPVASRYFENFIEKSASVAGPDECTNCTHPWAAHDTDEGCRYCNCPFGTKDRA